MLMHTFRRFGCNVSLGFVLLVSTLSGLASTNVYLMEVPDYEWHFGCFGTAGGNLMGYWDRHGFPNFYTGPTANGVAPLNSFGDNGGIRALWASQAGIDGRPLNKPGHVDDYYVAYLSTLPDPYIAANRPEHEPDCIGDFIGLDQNKWKNMNGECDGNVDGYSFVYWDATGNRRVNFTPGPEAGLPAIDIQSGLRSWTQYRERVADTFTQLVDFNPEVPANRGFTFEDLKAEIDAGYPVLFFLQDVRTKFRDLTGMDHANPLIHGILAYGYLIADDGTKFVRYRTSFAGGDNIFARWSLDVYWAGIAPLRGVIGYHPHPQITSLSQDDSEIRIEWDGPASELYDAIAGTYTKLHWYVVEKATSLSGKKFQEVTTPTADHHVILPIGDEPEAYYRIKMLPASAIPE